MTAPKRDENQEVLINPQTGMPETEQERTARERQDALRRTEAEENENN